MCGIVGNVGNPCKVARVLASLAHRGPDGKGHESFKQEDKQIWLGHTRLSILDPSPAGKQPMQSRDKRWWLIFNGEIYNHLNLKKKLSSTFRGHSDTETLVEVISQQGIDSTLPQLNGMFAFAALDTQESKLYLARDPFGVKPLYYTQKGKEFSFASEVRVFRAMGLVLTELDQHGLQSFLTLRYVPSPKTIWKGINRLAPGHLLCLNLKTMAAHLHRFVTPVTKRFSGTLNDAVECYQTHLKNAVQRQLLSDVPVGMLLSGGIDSALIAAMAKDAGCALPCFTVGFGDKHAECEIRSAEETARTLGLPISSVTVTPELLRESLPGIVRSVEEPLGTTSIMPMWYLVHRAQQDVSVVLTGQGADEPLGGYRRYQVEMVRKMLPWSTFWHSAAIGSRLIWKHFPEVVERGLRTLSTQNQVDRNIEACSLFTTKERRLLTGSPADGGALQVMTSWFDWLEESHCEPAECMMRVDTRMNLADDLLLYGDKISMATSLEARVPMLDIELVKFVESLPLHYRLALRRTKIVHKLMADRYLPAAIVQRKKQGFQVPFGAWSRGQWRTYIEDILLPADAPHFGCLDRKTVLTFWEEHVTSRRDRSRQMFALLMLVLWWRESVVV